MLEKGKIGELTPPNTQIIHLLFPILQPWMMPTREWDCVLFYLFAVVRVSFLLLLFLFEHIMNIMLAPRRGKRKKNFFNFYWLS
jgi:hypothetical protein